MLSIKPNKTAFILTSVINRVILAGIGGLAFAFFVFLPSLENEVGVWGLAIFIIIPAILGLLSFIPAIIDSLIRVNKEEYILTEDKIILRTGSLFSDREVELPIKNITHLDRAVPWLDNMLFGTGDIAVESAGSELTEIRLRCVDNYNEVTKEILERMGKNGFSLKSKEILFQEKPAVIGIVLESGAWVAAVAIFLFFFGFGYVASIALVMPLLGIGIGILAILGITVVFVLKFLDLQNRVYTIYRDTIIYNEGFLNKHYAIMPVENLTDSSIYQGLLQRILGIYNVAISTKGSGDEIVFRNMPNGARMEKVIDEIAGRRQSQSVPVEHKHTQETAVSGQHAEKHTQRKAINYSNFTATLRTNWLVVCLGGFINIAIGVVTTIALVVAMQLFALEALGIVAIINLVMWLVFAGINFVNGTIKYYANTYYVQEGSIRHDFKFLNAESIDFNLDKITGVVISRSIFHRIMGVADIMFYSIGSGRNLIFQAVSIKGGIVESILEKFAFQRQGTKLLEEIKPTLNPAIWAAQYFLAAPVYAVLFGLVLLGIAIGDGGYILSIITASIILITGIIIVVQYVSLAGASLRLFEGFVEVESGFFSKRYDYCHYEHIKDLYTMKYPFVDYGSLKMNIAGEQVVVTNSNQQQQQYYNPGFRNSNFSSSSGVQIITTMFGLQMLPKISELDNLLDAIMLHRPSRETYSRAELLQQVDNKVELEAKPGILNPLIAMAPLCIFLFPLILILPFVALDRLFRSYRLEEERLVETSGIFFKRQLSLLYKNIDHIEKHQGFLGKLFKNGTIDIHTVGSSLLEVRLLDLSNYHEVYNALQEKIAKK